MAVAKDKKYEVLQGVMYNRKTHVPGSIIELPAGIAKTLKERGAIGDYKEPVPEKPEK